jgi:enoyl-CoA hydratase/carnithine racemase
MAQQQPQQATQEPDGTFASLGVASCAAYGASAPMRHGFVRLVPADADGLAVAIFDRPRKLNGWNQPMLADVRQAFEAAAADSAVRGLVVTASGRYYSAGAAFGEMSKPMLPSTLAALAEGMTRGIFETYLAFPKLLVAAVNGPAIGAGCTSLGHADLVVASTRATFSTPFARLGVPPEGCSPLAFPARMGAVGAAAMLGEEGRTLDAAEARRAGLVDVVADDAWTVTGEGREQRLSCERGPEELLRAAKAAAAAWLAAPEAQRRRRPSWGRLEEFRAANRAEAAALARALSQPPFIEGQLRLAREKGKPTWLFAVARLLQPVLAAGDAAVLALLGAVLALLGGGAYRLLRALLAALSSSSSSSSSSSRL